MRTCIGCRRRTGKTDLVRIVRGADGTVHLDAAGTAPGRGAYVCANIECLEQAIRKRRVTHALRIAPGEGLDELVKEFDLWRR